MTIIRLIIYNINIFGILSAEVNMCSTVSCLWLMHGLVLEPLAGRLKVFIFACGIDMWAVQAKYFIGVKGKAFYCAEVFG